MGHFYREGSANASLNGVYDLNGERIKVYTTGESGHRRNASAFAVDCLTYTTMSNHIHVVLRSRPDIVRGWTDEQVARRWLRLFPKRRTPQGNPAEPNEVELNLILLDTKRVAELRLRRSDISWWMKCTAEIIARSANKEDQVTGHFWEGRYKVQLLLDEALENKFTHDHFPYFHASS